jgi:ATP-dependent DNA helicase RecG
LNARDLKRLIAAGETLLVEFKGEARAQLSDDDVVEAIVCLANRASSEPAWLLIGVEDDGRVTGARPRHGDRTDRHRLQAMIANRTRPSLAVEVDVVTLDGQAVLAIQVPSTRVPVGTTEGR